MDTSLLVALTAPLALALAAGLFLWLAPAPRRMRAAYRARRLLDEGKWQEALQVVDRYLSNPKLPERSKPKLNHLKAECLQSAGKDALQGGEHEKALEHLVEVANLQRRPTQEARDFVLSRMMEEVRGRFASESERQLKEGAQPTFEDVQELITRVVMIDARHAEAYFWQAMILIKLGKPEEARANLENAHELGESKCIDPPYYLGALHYADGQFAQALRTLSEANRVDGGCPFVAWLMGRCMVAAESDSGMAVRILQRALGNRGLGLWRDRPLRAWIEAFPEGRSYVRRLAEKHRFICPIFGGELSSVIRWGQLALAQAQYRLGNYRASADLYELLLKDSPPSLLLLQGLGLSLARLGEHDEAFKHLRLALEMSPQDPLLTGYVALCGAMGEPIDAEDKHKNVEWALQQFARFDVVGDPEWAEMLRKVHHEARSHNVKTSVEDQLRAANVLVSVLDHTPEAAATYDALAQVRPDLVNAQHAWLYCRSAARHGVHGTCDAELFERTFETVADARAFFQQQQWDFDEVEHLFLERSAATAPGRFPRVLGDDHAPMGERFLLARSQAMEQDGDIVAALQCVTTLLALAPASLAAHDRLALLQYRLGELEQASASLGQLHQLDPKNPLPLIRQAVMEHRRSDWSKSESLIRQALAMTDGTCRADIAYLGARLALSFRPDSQTTENSNGTDGASPSKVIWAQAEQFLVTALDAASHLPALFTLVAMRCLRDDRKGLKELLPHAGDPDVADDRYRYLTALCHLAAGNDEQVLEWAGLVASDASLMIECEYLKAWAHLRLRNQEAAQEALQVVAKSESLAGDHARALLGGLSFSRGAYVEAVKWWGLIMAEHRKQWKCDEPLRQCVLLTALTAMERARYEQAAERFREAGRIGLREKNLGELIRLALFKDGKRLFYQE